MALTDDILGLGVLGLTIGLVGFTFNLAKKISGNTLGIFGK